MQKICTIVFLILFSASNVFAASPQTAKDCGKQTTITKGGTVAGIGAGCYAGAKCLLLMEPLTVAACWVAACAAGGFVGGGTGYAADKIIETKNCAGSVFQTVNRRHWHVIFNDESAAGARKDAERGCRAKGKGSCYEAITFRHCAAPAVGVNAAGQKEYVWTQGFDASQARLSAVALCKKRGLKNCSMHHRSYCNEN